MSTPNPDGLKIEIDQGRMRVGNQIQLSTGLPATASTLMFSDSSSNLSASATLPFTPVLAAGTTSTSSSALSISGSATLTANDIMHQTLVAGAGVTTFTSAGFARVTVTDAAGNITNGDYYIQFGTLS